MALLGPDMKPLVEPGVFDVMVGPSSAETTTAALDVREGEVNLSSKPRGRHRRVEG